jgi:hypothetical protein
MSNPSQPNGVKPFDFDAVFSSLEMEEAGIEVPIMKDEPNGGPSGFVIKLAGPNSKRQRAAQEEAVKRARARPPDYKASVQEMLDGVLDTLVAATISWKYPDGFEGPPCTPDNVRRIYTQHGGVRQQVEQAALNVSRFMKR